MGTRKQAINQNANTPMTTPDSGKPSFGRCNYRCVSSLFLTENILDLRTYSDSWRGWHVTAGVRVEQLALVLADHHRLVGYLLDETFSFGFADVKVQRL